MAANEQQEEWITLKKNEKSTQTDRCYSKSVMKFYKIPYARFH